MKADHQQSFLQRLCQDLPAVSNYMIKGSTWSAFTRTPCEIGFEIYTPKGKKEGYRLQSPTTEK